jgi:hypothetical protein
MVTVLRERICVDVAKVTVDAGVSGASRKTSAKQGAGTGTEHVDVDVSHGTVVTFSVPERRPSAWKVLPSVCVCVLSCGKINR